MQALICSPCCSSHQESRAHLAYFSFPVNYFGHLDAIWGALKETRTRQNEQGALAASWHRPGGCGAASILTFLHPWHFSGSPASPQWPAQPQVLWVPCPGDSPAAGYHRGAIPRLQDAVAALPCQALVEMSPLWQPDRRAPQDPPAHHNGFASQLTPVLTWHLSLVWLW